MTNKFPKTRNLKGVTNFQSIFRANNSFLTESWKVYCSRNGDGKLGIVTSRRVVKLAVGRNKIKRIVKNNYRKKDLIIPDIVLLLSKDISKIDNKIINKELDTIWQKLSHAYQN